MTIPLTPPTIDILERRRKSTNSFFVFPSSRSKTGHYVEPRKAWTTILRRSGLKNVTIHDLRRTLGSWQTMEGASHAVVGKSLGHRSPASTAIYARMNLDPVRRSMENAANAILTAKNLPPKISDIRGGGNG